MPVEFNKNDGMTEIEFLRNTAYEGTDYGPDYEGKTALVANNWARYFIAQGRAKAVRKKEKGKDEPAQTK